MTSVRLLVLIIASNDLPVYSHLETIWRQYGHKDPERVTCFFMKAHPTLTSEVVIQDDIILCKTQESIIPGILNKTIISLQALDALPTDNRMSLSSYDYVLRCNLSSFYIFPRLLRILESSPRTHFYYGTSIGDGVTGSGCGFILSKDVAHVLASESSLIGKTDSNDDLVIGHFLINKGYRLKLHHRVDRFTKDPEPAWLHEVERAKHDESIFHFRTKLPNDERLVYETEIRKELLRLFV